MRLKVLTGLLLLNYVAKRLGELCQERSTGGRQQLGRLIGLLNHHAASTQDLQGGRSGQRKTPVSTLHEPNSLNHRTSQNPRSAQHFQSHASSHDVHNRVDRPDLMKMDLVRRHPMDFTLRDRDAMEDRLGLLFYPRRQRASPDQFPDL